MPQAGNTEILDCLFKRGCLQFSVEEPFQYASGLKGPIYCDNRKLLSYPKDRVLVAKSFARVWREKGWSETTLVAGMATAGIAHAAFLATELALPMVYVRSKPKGHGKGNQIEGAYQKGDEVVLLEDLVNQASSLAQGIEGVRKEGLKVHFALSIVDYQMPEAQERLKSYNVNLLSLVNFDEIIKYGVESKKLSEHQAQIIYQWKEEPKAWS